MVFSGSALPPNKTMTLSPTPDAVTTHIDDVFSSDKAKVWELFQSIGQGTIGTGSNVDNEADFFRVRRQPHHVCALQDGRIMFALSHILVQFL
jgi:hypothetical protein